MVAWTSAKLTESASRVLARELQTCQVTMLEGGHLWMQWSRKANVGVMHKPDNASTAFAQAAHTSGCVKSLEQGHGVVRKCLSARLLKGLRRSAAFVRLSEVKSMRRTLERVVPNCCSALRHEASMSQAQYTVQLTVRLQRLSAFENN